jgi:hypothetical protein
MLSSFNTKTFEFSEGFEVSGAIPLFLLVKAFPGLA